MYYPRPILLEVNCSPALGLEEATDKEVKLPLISDLLDLSGVERATREVKALRDQERSRKSSVPRYSRPLSTAAAATQHARDKDRSRERSGWEGGGTKTRGGTGKTNGFELIYPFDTESENLARDLSQHARAHGGRKDMVRL